MVRKYLECGDLEQGFARVRCPDCHHEYLLAFSCRGRWFCPSCHSKKVVQFGNHLHDNVLFPVPHRQYVFSIPKIIRRFFLYDRKLLGKLSQCAASCLTRFFRITLGKNLGIPGIALAIQTFGDYAKWHPHIHALVADGLFTETWIFYVMPRVDIRPLTEIFRASILKMLKDEGRLDDPLIKKILTWRHNSGFSVHNEVRLQAGDAKGIENVAQYIIRNKRNFQTYSPLEFIASITQHIPERLAQMVRYYGWYSNRMRGDHQRDALLQDETEKATAENPEVIIICNFRTKKIPPLVWRECIKKVWEVNPLICPHCGGEMRIISFIHERIVIKKILVHLGLYLEGKRQRAPPVESPDPEVTFVPVDDGWPGYEEPCYDIQV